jgi:hypothetical protein
MPYTPRDETAKVIDRLPPLKALQSVRKEEIVLLVEEQLCAQVLEAFAQGLRASGRRDQAATVYGALMHVRGPAPSRSCIAALLSYSCTQ